MDWIDSLQRALGFMEAHLLEEGLDAEAVAKQIYVSGAHFQKIFHIITGVTVGEYIRSRRLSLAGEELLETQAKVIDLALRYGYDTPEAFTKAFTRFHGVTPTAAREGAKLNEFSLKFFHPLTIQIRIEGGLMTRKLIPNVAKLYEIKSENYMFPSCMRSAMAALGENPAFDFAFFAGVTGDFFTQLWCEPRWQYNDSYSNVCKDTQKPIQAAFDACGYDYEYVPRDGIQSSKAKYVRKIVASIDKGLPVLTYGIVGPPVCSIICGYAEDGEALIGWSQFTDEVKEDEPMDLVPAENYFQVRGGLDESFALIFIGDKKERPSVAESLRQSILNIPKWVSMPPETPDGRQIYFGQAAYEAWADSLLRDEDFADESMLASPLDTYGSCVVLTGTNMHYMQRYLQRAAQACPDMAPRIRKLKRQFKRLNRAFQRLTRLQGGYFFEKDRKALLHRKLRVRLAAQVREVGRRYAAIQAAR